MIDSSLPSEVRRIRRKGRGVVRPLTRWPTTGSRSIVCQSRAWAPVPLSWTTKKFTWCLETVERVSLARPCSSVGWIRDLPVSSHAIWALEAMATQWRSTNGLSLKSKTASSWGRARWLLSPLDHNKCWYSVERPLSASWWILGVSTTTGGSQLRHQRRNSQRRRTSAWLASSSRVIRGLTITPSTPIVSSSTTSRSTIWLGSAKTCAN